jgi:hypothetical protein
MYLWGEEIAILSEMASVHDSDASSIVELEVQRLLKVCRNTYIATTHQPQQACMLAVSEL